MLRALRDTDAPTTVTELATQAGLSRPTVDAVLPTLIHSGAVRDVGPAPKPVPGRPARRFSFQRAATVVAAVDIGVHRLRCVLADPAGGVVGRWSVPADERRTVLQAVESVIGGSVTELGSAAKTDQQPRVAAVGIAVPGILDSDDRVTQSLAVPSLVGADLTGELSDRLGCPVIVENDIKLAGYAEHHVGAGRGVDDQVYLQIGHRISVAIIINGAILQGSHRLAGELGSQRGMRWTESSTRGQLRWSSGENAEEVFHRAARGESAAIAEVDAFCAEIAPKIAALLLTVDPDLVVVGGGLSRAGRTLLDPLSREVGRLLITAPRPRLIAADLGADGPITGALGYAFEHSSTAVFGIEEMPPPWPQLAEDLHPDPHLSAMRPNPTY